MGTTNGHALALMAAAATLRTPRAAIGEQSGWEENEAVGLHVPDDDTHGDVEHDEELEAGHRRRYRGR